jgi:hypothetical protein
MQPSMQPISANEFHRETCLRCFSSTPHKIVILSGASRIYAFHSPCSAESKDPGGAYSTHAARSFSTPEARTGRPCNGFCRDLGCRMITVQEKKYRNRQMRTAGRSFSRGFSG